MTVGDHYDAIYRGATGSSRPPWDIGAPQPALARLLDAGLPGPKVLDAGCGTGELALALARRGYQVTAVDVSPVAIELARAKAADAGLTVHFDVQDATHLALPDAPFHAIFDSGLLHSLDRLGDAGAQAYLALLPGLAAPGASVYVLAVSPAAGQGWGLTEEYLRAAFAEPDWVATQVAEIDVYARVDRDELRLAGLLLQTRRAAY